MKRHATKGKHHHLSGELSYATIVLSWGSVHPVRLANQNMLEPSTKKQKVGGAVPFLFDDSSG